MCERRVASAPLQLRPPFCATRTSCWLRRTPVIGVAWAIAARPAPPASHAWWSAARISCRCRSWERCWRNVAGAGAGRQAASEEAVGHSFCWREMPARVALQMRWCTEHCSCRCWSWGQHVRSAADAAGLLTCSSFAVVLFVLLSCRETQYQDGGFALLKFRKQIWRSSLPSTTSALPCFPLCTVFLG